MKTLVRNILVVAVMVLTCTGYANETLEVVKTTIEVKRGNYISVTDASGEIVYSARVNYTGNLARLFDFTQLKDGIYKIEVDKDFVIEKSSIQVKNKIVTFLKESEEKFYKPVFRSKDSKIFISKLALKSEVMTVELYYKDELIKKETISGDNILNRVYQLDEKIRGDYTAIIKSNDRVFVENFRI